MVYKMNDIELEQTIDENDELYDSIDPLIEELRTIFSDIPSDNPFRSYNYEFDYDNY